MKHAHTHTHTHTHTHEKEGYTYMYTHTHGEREREREREREMKATGGQERGSKMECSHQSTCSWSDHSQFGEVVPIRTNPVFIPISGHGRRIRKEGSHPLKISQSQGEFEECASLSPARSEDEWWYRKPQSRLFDDDLQTRLLLSCLPTATATATATAATAAFPVLVSVRRRTLLPCLSVCGCVGTPLTRHTPDWALTDSCRYRPRRALMLPLCTHSHAHS